MKTLFAAIAVTILSVSGLMLLQQTDVGAQARDAIKGGAQTTSGASANKVDSTIERVVNLLSIIVGIIAVIMIIVAGIQFITAQGDSNSIARARNVIIYAAVGLVIVAIAQTIVRFILKETGV